MENRIISDREELSEKGEALKKLVLAEIASARTSFLNAFQLCISQIFFPV